MNYQDCLQNMTSAAAALEQALREECELLVQRPEPEALHNIAERKSLISDELSRLEQQRQQLTASNNTAEHELPQSLRDCLSRCQQLNLRVGAHISAQSRYTGRALEILGQGDAGSLYTPAGAKKVATDGHALGKA